MQKIKYGRKGKKMRSPTRFLLFLSPLLILAFHPVTATAGDWMLSEKDVIYSSGLTYSTDNVSWDQQYKLHRKCSSSNAYLFQGVEYGYSYYHTLFLNTALASQNCGSNHTSGIGDFKMGIRGRLDNEHNSRTWELTAIIPTGYSRSKALRLGNGVPGIEAGAFYSGRNQGWEDPFASYLDAGISVRYWFGAPASQIRGYLGVQKPISSTQKIALRIYGNVSWRDAKPEILALNQLQTSDYDQVYLEARYNYHLTPYWSVTASMGHDVWGRNTVRSTYLSISFSHAWWSHPNETHDF